MSHTASHPLIGCPVDQLDTPALCIDRAALDRNIQRVVAVCRQHGIDWRPHAKGHKSPHIATLQRGAGAIGVTCAKLGEAEVMSHAGIDDILIANQIVGPAKLRRLVELGPQRRPMVCVDHRDQVAALSEAAAGTNVRLLLEVDIGLNRAGVAPGEPAVELARQVARSPGLELAGIMGYEGHLLALADPWEKQQRIRAALSQLVSTKHDLERAGLPCSIVSCGGTGSFSISVTCPGITEVQAGGLIFMDAFYRHACQVHDFEYALTVLTTVVSRPAADRAIIDAGRKSVHGEIHVPLVLGDDGVPRDDVIVDRLSAEHGWLRLEPTAADLRIGERLVLIPGYGDLTCVLYDEFYVLRAGIVEEVWPLVARSRAQ
jgi:D-serine deaminase-like pyridoxal phosphate-dependent protein